MADLKHVGRVASNRRKCAVVFRTLPGDPDSCLILPTENLLPEDHDAVINLLESNAGQTAYEFAEAMDRALLNDGSRMLPRFHATGKLVKMATKDIEMVPNHTASVMLSELNQIIADQRGVTIADLTVSPSNAERTRDLGEPAAAEQPVNSMDTNDTVVETSEKPMSDEDLAAQYRSQADRLYKEAKALREQAEELVPTKRKAKAKTEESA